MHHAPPTLLLVALALSGAGLLAGPLILSLGRGRATAGALVEGLALGLVPTMVLLRLLPHVAESLGGLAIVLFAGAFLVLRAFDRAHHRAAARMGRAFIYSALLLHSFTDGVGLAAAIAVGHGAVDVTLTAAFVFHRLPEGLFIATTLLPSYGWRRTLERTLGLFGATVAGGLLGGALLPLLSERLFDAVVAVGLGAMLQLVLHSHAERPNAPATRALTSASLIAGVVVALLVPAQDDLLAHARGAELPVTRSLAPLFVHVAPALLLALLLASALHALVRMAAPDGGRRAGLLFALLGPVGPAQVVPAARGLALHGASRATTSLFLLAAAALTLDGTFLLARLVGPVLAALQLVGALALALVGTLGAPSHEPRLEVRVRATRVLHAFSVLALRGIDQVGAPLITGLIVAAGIEASIDPAWLVAQPVLPLLVLPLLALACGVTPVLLAAPVAVLLHKGVAPAAVLAMLLAGPLGGRSRREQVTPHRIAFFVLAWLASALVGLGLAAAVHIDVPPLHAWSATLPSVAELACSGLLALLLVVSLLRLGPKLWLGQLAHEPRSEHDHEHDHEHHAEHAHEHPVDAAP